MKTIILKAHIKVNKEPRSREKSHVPRSFTLRTRTAICNEELGHQKRRKRLDRDEQRNKQKINKWSNSL